jgi:hypothetical protein
MDGGADRAGRMDLIAAAVENTLDDAGAAALAGLAGRDAAVLRALRLHLLIDEVAAQELLPVRSAAAFAAGLDERRRAQSDGFAFLARVRARVAAEDRVLALLSAPQAAPDAAHAGPDTAPPIPITLLGDRLPSPWLAGSAAAAVAAGVLLYGAVGTQNSPGAGTAPVGSLIAHASANDLYAEIRRKDGP